MRIRRMILVLSLLCTSAAGIATNMSSAEAFGCNPQNAGWGYGDFCQSNRVAGIQDTQSDGHCVNLEYRTYSGGWQYLAQSCGSVVLYTVPADYHQVRMIRTGYPWPSVLLWTP